MGKSSGIGVLDKTMLILSTVAEEPCSLNELCERSEIPRATAHRLAIGMEKHRLLARDSAGLWHPGPALSELAAKSTDTLLEAAQLVLPRLRDITGESVQLYRVEDGQRVCIAACEPHTGLRDTVPVGAVLPLYVGASSKVLVAWAEPSIQQSVLSEGEITEMQLRDTRRRGWAQSIGEREPGVASVAVPVVDARGKVIAAVSVSGPIERISKRPANLWAADLKTASSVITKRL
ncbi:MAG: IclR family transcriptional regulator [Lawsonella sp.]|nr:IclR family transcriptional regulator [Mycobacteriales bacterium]